MFVLNPESLTWILLWKTVNVAIGHGPRWWLKGWLLTPMTVLVAIRHC